MFSPSAINDENSPQTIVVEKFYHGIIEELIFPEAEPGFSLTWKVQIQRSGLRVELQI